MNLCITRLPKGESILFPPSHCPFCGAGLKVWDLIPIFSYLLLKGRCRYCQKPLSPRYLAVEVLSALAFPLFFLKFGPTLSFFFGLTFFSLLAVVTFTDLEQWLIPDKIVLTGIILGLIFAFMEKRLLAALLAMALGGGLVYLIGKGGSLLFKKEALGDGDVTLTLMLGAYLGGLKLLLLALFLSVFLGALFGLALIFLGMKKKSEYIPFAPALSLGALTALFFGEELLRWYLNLL